MTDNTTRGKLLDGKVAIVTGSGQGIGRAVASHLAAEGARVVVNSRRRVNDDGTPTADDALREIHELGGTAAAVYADVSTLDGCAEVVETAIDTYGRLDILVNNAGSAGTLKPVSELSGEEWASTVDVNLTSQFGCCHFAIPHLSTSGSGRIVNVSSNIGMYGKARMAPYAASKAASIGLTFALANELADAGITVNCILPTSSTIRLELTRAEREGAVGVLLKPSPLRVPEAVAPLFGFLCTDAAATVNGQVFYVAGGQITHYAWPPVKRTLLKHGHWSLDELREVLPRYFGEVLEVPEYPVPLS